MLTSITSPADAVNASLRLLGRPERVGHLYDGSAAGKAFLDVYGQTRDALLRSRSWGFAQQDAVLTAASVGPPPGWSYIYLWPANCLLVRSIAPIPIPVPALDPDYLLFRPFQDPTIGRAIIATISPALAIFTARVTDPTQWDVGFTSSFIAQLTGIVKAGLANNPNLLREIDGEAAESLEMAITGSELQPPNDAPVMPRAAAQ